MIRGLYFTAADMRAEITRQGILSNNLANINTVGYKQDFPTLHMETVQVLMMDTGPGNAAPLVGELGGPVANQTPQLDFSQGPLEATRQNLDLAILGEGFFQVVTEETVGYTRDGAFHRDAAGRLVTSDGYLVMGEDGPIMLGDGEVAIAEDGTIYVNEQRVNRIALVRFADNAVVQRQGDNLLIADEVDLVPANETHIRQGFLERSNVDPAGNLVAMMSTLRAYEASQRLLQINDETLQRALEIGRPA